MSPLGSFSQLPAIEPTADSSVLPEPELVREPNVGATAADSPRGRWARLAIRVGRWAELAVFGSPPLVAACFIVLLAVLLWLRAPYAGELEWMEGGSLAHVMRVLRGQPLYQRPDIDFVPFIYPPLYYWLGALVSSALSWTMDPSLLALRLVSIGATAGTMTVLGAFVRSRGGGWGSVIVALGVFAATFRVGGAWFDVARVDSLHTFLSLFAIHLLVNGTRFRSGAGAGLVITLAVFTKQSTLMSWGILLSWCLLQRDRRALIFAGISMVLSVSLYVALQAQSHGWFSYYVFEVPSHHQLIRARIADFWRDDVWATLAVPALLSCYAVSAARNSHERLSLLATLLALVVPSWPARFHTGMYDNVLMPMHAGLALGAGLAMAVLTRHIAALKNKANEDATVALTVRHLRAVRGAFCVGLLCTFWRLEYPVLRQLPNETQLRSADAARTLAAGLPDGSWAPCHLSLTATRPGAPLSQAMAVFDLTRDSNDRVSESVKRGFMKRLQMRGPPVIVLPPDGGQLAWLLPAIRKYYRLTQQEIVSANLTGYSPPPARVWVRKKRRG